MYRGVARLVAGPKQLATSPLTIAQALSSASGAGSIFIAAALMSASEFTRFSLFNLVGSVLLGLIVAGLLQPALISQRRHPNGSVPFRYAALATAPGCLLFLGTALVLDVRDPLSLLALSLSAAVPLLYGWLRFRAMGMDRRWLIVQADALRLLLTATALVLPGVARDSIDLQVYLSVSLLLPVLLLIVRLPRASRPMAFRTYSAAAGWQLIDFTLGQFLIALPVFALGTTGSPLIGGVRLAQSLLGPLNLVFAATTANLVADGATRSELAADTAVVARGVRQGHLLGGVSLVVVLAMLAIAYPTGISFRGVDNGPLMLGLALVGIALTTTSWAGIHAVVLRVLGLQARVTVGRGLIAAPTVAAFALGWVFGGVDVSLVVGFLTLTVASPVIFLTMGRRTYRRLRSAEDAAVL